MSAVAGSANPPSLATVLTPTATMTLRAGRAAGFDDEPTHIEGAGKLILHRALRALPRKDGSGSVRATKTGAYSVPLKAPPSSTRF